MHCANVNKKWSDSDSDEDLFGEDTSNWEDVSQDTDKSEELLIAALQRPPAPQQTALTACLGRRGAFFSQPGPCLQKFDGRVIYGHTEVAGVAASGWIEPVVIFFFLFTPTGVFSSFTCHVAQHTHTHTHTHRCISAANAYLCI